MLSVGARGSRSHPHIALVSQPHWDLCCWPGGISLGCQQCPGTTRSQTLSPLTNPSYLLEPDASLSAGISKWGRLGYLAATREVMVFLWICAFSAFFLAVRKVCQESCWKSAATCWAELGLPWGAANFTQWFREMLPIGMPDYFHVLLCVPYSIYLWFLVMLNVWVYFPPFFNIDFI